MISGTTHVNAPSLAFGARRKLGPLTPDTSSLRTFAFADKPSILPPLLADVFTPKRCLLARVAIMPSGATKSPFPKQYDIEFAKVAGLPLFQFRAPGRDRAEDLAPFVMDMPGAAGQSATIKTMPEIDAATKLVTDADTVMLVMAPTNNGRSSTPLLRTDPQMVMQRKGEWSAGIHQYWRYLKRSHRALIQDLVREADEKYQSLVGRYN